MVLSASKSGCEVKKGAMEVYVADYPQFNGAVGAALIASERGGA